MKPRSCTFLFLSWVLMVSTGATPESAEAQGSTSAPALKEQILALKGQGFSEESLIAYLDQVVLASPLSTEDMADWKRSGIPEPVIQAAMRRVSGSARTVTVSIESKLIPLELIVEPMVFHSVRIQLWPPKQGMVTVTFIVKASNPGDQDYDGIVKATLLSEDGSAIVSETKRREIEEGEKNKDIKVELKVREAVFNPKVTGRLEFSLS